MYWFVAANIALALFFTLVLYSTLLSRTGLSYAALRPELNHGMIAFVLWPPIVIALAGWASLRRQYALPVPTYRLVAWSMANGVAATLMIFGILCLALDAIYRADWPFWQPALCAATLYLFLQAVLWSSGSSRLLALLALWAAIMLGGSLGIEWVLQPLLEVKEPGTEGIAAVTIAAMLVIAALSYGLAVNGVARDRRGDAWSLGFFVRLWQSLGDSTAAVWKRSAARVVGEERFRSPSHAQLWLEWRAKGRVCVLAVALTMIGLGIGLIFIRPTSADASGALAGVIGILVTVSPFVGVYLGSDSGGFDRKTFAATRPLTDRAIAAAVLKNVALVVVLGTLIWLAGALAIAAFWETQEWRELQKEWGRGVDLNRGIARLVEVFVGTWFAVLYVWALCALGASLAMARSWFVAAAGLVLLVLIAVLVRSMAFAAWPPPLLALCCLLATITAFLAAYAQRLVSPWAVIGCLAAYILFVASVLASSHDNSPSPHFQMCLIGFAAVPFAPFAAAPLALAWNRHR